MSDKRILTPEQEKKIAIWLNGPHTSYISKPMSEHDREVIKALMIEHMDEKYDGKW